MMRFFLGSIAGGIIAVFALLLVRGGTYEDDD